MKRSEFNRTAFKRPSEGAKQLTRTRLARVGKRVGREKEARKAFSEYFMYMPCLLCLPANNHETTVGHHLCSKARGAGHDQLHSIKNGVPLCSEHHDGVHSRNENQHLLKSRDFLDTLT